MLFTIDGRDYVVRPPGAGHFMVASAAYDCAYRAHQRAGDVTAEAEGCKAACAFLAVSLTRCLPSNEPAFASADDYQARLRAADPVAKTACEMAAKLLCL